MDISVSFISPRSNGAIARHVAVPERMAARETRRRAELRGRHAEDDVAAQYAANGYSILARRLRTGCGEIDLVVANARTLIFVEVKARPSAIACAYAVTPRQQARLWEAASCALAQHPEWEREGTIFNVALVSPAGIEHIEDAIRYQ
ncbi:MAG: YraN family protein [Acidocella sp.]|nr:YraN family protein [Acidocella sp.]